MRQGWPRRPRLHLVMACGLATFACRQIVAENLPLPELNAYRSLLLVVVPDEGEAEVWAFDKPLSPPVLVQAPTLQFSAYVLTYPCPLAVYGLVHGRVRLSVSGVPLPAAVEVWGTKQGSASSPWSAADPAQLNEILIDAKPLDRCAHLAAPISVQRAPVPAEGNALPTFAMALDAATALVGTWGQTGANYYEVSSDSAKARDDLGFPPETVAALTLEAGPTLTFDRNGGIHQGHIGQEFQRVATATGSVPSDGVAVDRSPDGTDEVFAVFQAGQVVRGSAGNFEVVARLNPADHTRDVDIAWVGAGEAYVVAGNATPLFHLRGNVVTALRLPLEVAERPQSVERLPDGAVLLGTTQGRILRQLDRSAPFEYVDRAPTQSVFGNFVTAFSAFGDGFIAGSERDLLVHNHRHGVCAIGPTKDARPILPIGDRWLVVSRGPGGPDPNVVEWLSIEGPATCGPL
ncbi:MAG: hypothetical protein IPG45_02140 [Deltaproteobacteria bacterium]|nr:hypothetical protein [Deltaproteobacteria bacterium]